MSTGGRKGREAKMYIVEFIFFGGSRLFRETLTSVDEVEQFLRGFDELEQKLIYINIIRKITSWKKQSLQKMSFYKWTVLLIEGFIFYALLILKILFYSKNRGGKMDEQEQRIEVHAYFSGLRVNAIMPW